MSDEHIEKEKAQIAENPCTEQDSDMQSDSTSNTGRRQFLKAGLVAAPLVLTFKSQPVWAQMQGHISGASPWYRGPWNARGDVLVDNVTDADNDGDIDNDDRLHDDNILKYRDPMDVPMGSLKPAGDSNEKGITR